jgi:hypothetical protein
VFFAEDLLYILPKQLKDVGSVSLSTFKNNIYFWEISNGQKCLGKSKMDKKNVQFLKTLGLYGNRNFLKVILHHNALNTEIFIEKVLP